MSEVPAKSKDHDKAETLKHLTGYLEAYPGLRGRVCRILLLHLHSQGYVSVDEIYRRAERAEEGEEDWVVPQMVPEAAADEAPEALPACPPPRY